MTTIREILDIEKNGRNTIKEQKELNEIVECIDDLTGFFVGSKRVNRMLNEMSGNFVEYLKKAMNTLKVYENKALNEEDMSSSAARILAYDIHKYLVESYKELTSQKRAFKEMNKENVSKVYSTMLFELEALCNKYDIILEDFIKDEQLVESISDDMAKIINEVL